MGSCKVSFGYQFVSNVLFTQQVMVASPEKLDPSDFRLSVIVTMYRASVDFLKNIWSYMERKYFDILNIMEVLQDTMFVFVYKQMGYK